MTTEANRILLEKLKLIHQDSEARALHHYFENIHVLAEAQYQPALAFFITCLDDTRKDWREYCLKALGFHFDISEDIELINKIRIMLASDSSSDVRLTAAGVLGGQLNDLDIEFIELLDKENDHYVNHCILEQCLSLAKVKYDTVNAVMETISENEDLISSQEAIKIIEDLLDG